MTEAPHRTRILCVDDDPRALRSLRRLLRRTHDLVLCESATEALALLEAEDFPVLLTDMRMPGMDGAELCAAAKRLRPETVRIVLTGYADQQQEDLARGVGGVFRALQKPCERAELLAALGDAVEHHERLRAGTRVA